MTNLTDNSPVVLNVATFISEQYGEESFQEQMYDQAFLIGVDADRLELNYFSNEKNSRTAQAIINMTIGSWELSTKQSAFWAKKREEKRLAKQRVAWKNRS